jgi:hypothetical protein
MAPADGYLKLLVGGVGSKFPVMHFDGENAHAAITQIYGEKEFVVFSARGHAPCLSEEVRAQSLDGRRPGDAGSRTLSAPGQGHALPTVLGPGDMIFVPARWWHAARALTTSISVCTNMLDGSKLGTASSREVVGNSKLPAADAKRLESRLRRVGRWADAFERLQARSPLLARLLGIPVWLAPISGTCAPEPSRKQLAIRIPTA